MFATFRARFVLALGCVSLCLLGMGGLGAGEKDKGVEVLATLKGHSELVYSVEMKRGADAQAFLAALSALNANNKVVLVTGQQELDL